MNEHEKSAPREILTTLERRKRLDREAAEFFASESNRTDREDAAERRAYQELSIRSLVRDEG
jgi:hypothetical protein